MDWLITVLDWLKNSDNRTVLTFIGGGIVVVAGAIWKVYEHYDTKKTKALEQAQEKVQQSKSAADSNTTSLPAIPERAAIVPTDVAALRTAYLRLMAREWRTLPLEVVDHSAADAAARRLTLEKVYISLDTTTPRPESLPRKSSAGEREGPLSAVEALLHAEQQRLVLLGQPGSGKSTFGRYLSLTLAESLLNPGVVHLAEQLPGWTGPAVLPVFLPLRQFAASLTTATGKGSVGQVQAFIRRRLDEREALQGFGEALLQELRDRVDWLSSMVSMKLLVISEYGCERRSLTLQTSILAAGSW